MNKKFDILLKAIKNFRFKIRLFEFLKNVMNFSTLFFLVLFLLTLTELFLRSETETRIFEFYFLLIFCLILLLTLLIKTFTSDVFKLSLPKTARLIGALDTNIKDDIQNLLELNEQRQNDEKNDLLNAAITSLLNKINPKNFNSLIDKSILKKSVRYCLSVIIVFFLLLFVNDFSLSFKSLIFPNETFFQKEIVVWEISPGSKKIIKGSNVNVSVKTEGINSNSIFLNYKNSLQSDWNKKRIFKDSLEVFNSVLTKVNFNTEYYFSSGNNNSEINNLSVVNYPDVNSFKLKITPPAYSKLSQTFQIDNGNITALKGSKIEIEITSSNILETAGLNFSGSSKKLTTEKNKASGSFRVFKNDNYKISLTDTLFYKNQNPIEYSINVQTDSFPEIKILEPGSDVKLGSDNFVKFKIELKDDFGFNKLKLKYRLSASLFEEIQNNFSKKNISIRKNEAEQIKNYVWNFDELNLAAGDELTYYFSVFDNDNVSGPKYSKSQIFKIKVPSIEEILDETDQTYSETESDLTEVYEEAEKLKDEFDKLKNDLKKKDEKISYQEKNKIKDTLEKYEKLIEKSQEANEKLKQIEKTLAENNLLSESTLKKYQELQKLLNEIGSEDLAKAFENMNKMLEQMNRKNVQKQLDQIKFNEEQFKQSIERTLSLLKRLQVEQKLENLKNRIDDIIKEQNKILNKNENELNRQKEITKKTSSLEKETKELKDLMSEMKNMPQKEMEDFSDKLKQQDNQQESKAAEEDLKNNNQGEANKHQQKIKDNMTSLKNDAANMQDTMQKKNQLETLYDLTRVFNGLIELSQSQEEILSEAKKLNNFDSKFVNLAQQESKTKEKLSALFEQIKKISKKSFLITPELGRLFGDANKKMYSSINFLSDGHKIQSIKNIESTISSVNNSAYMIKKIIEMMLNSSGGSGGSGMSMMEQLKQMGQQQMNLNQLTQKMLQGEKLTAEQMGQMQRLAQQQDIIRRSLEKLNEENKGKGKSKSLSENLDKILEDMKEVIKKMNSSEVDSELKNKQDKILSKLLEAQRSINDRDFEEKRESKQGEIFKRISPEDLNNLKLLPDQLRDELIKSLKEGYSKDYEELIKRYFEELKKKKQDK